MNENETNAAPIVPPTGASGCSTIPEWQTRQRVVTATIRVIVNTHDKAKMYKVASFRKRDLEDWLKRHRKDIENEMAYCDAVSIDVVMGYADE